MQKTPFRQQNNTYTPNSEKKIFNRTRKRRVITKQDNKKWKQIRIIFMPKHIRA